MRATMRGSMDDAKTVARSSFHFLSGTAVSRVTGMLRDMLMAFCFGTEPAIAAFLVAFRLANLMRRIFGEGALTVGFIPHFEAIQKESPARATAFFRDLAFAMSGVLLLILGVGEGALIWLSNWSGFSADNQQIAYLTALMLPGVVFICLYALFAAVLQCQRSYFLPAVAPVAFNFVWLFAIWWLRDWPPNRAAEGLSLAVTAALALQWIVLVPSALKLLASRLSFRDWWGVRLFSPDLRLLLGSLSLGVVGVGAMQINSALDAIFGRAASLEGPAYLTYAIRLQQLPLALFAIAIASAVLPPLSRAMAANNRDKYLELLQFALSRTFSLVFPCTIGILVMGGAAVNLIYGRGHFSGESVVHTTTCLFGYGLGLVPAAFVILLASAFYSRKDYWIPTLASLISIAVNVALNAFLVFVLGWGAVSIAVATSAAALCNAWYLSYRLSATVGTGAIFSASLWSSFVKVAVCSCVAGAASLTVGYVLFADPGPALLWQPDTVFPTDWRTQILHFAALSGSFGIIFVAMAWLTDAKEILRLIDLRNHFARG